MAERKVDLKDTTMIGIRNNTGGGVTYRTDMGMTRRWEVPNSVLKINFLELQQAISQNGIRNMFVQGMLLVDDENRDEIMDVLGIPELDEYVCTLTEIDELLNGVDYEDFKNVLKWGSKSQTETIISIAANKGLKDANVISIIKEVTGVDVTVIEPDKPKAKTKTQDRPSRAKKEVVEEVEVKDEKPKRTPVKKAATKTK